MAMAAKGTAGGGEDEKERVCPWEGAYICTAARSSGWLLVPKRSQVKGPEHRGVGCQGRPQTMSTGVS